MSSSWIQVMIGRSHLRPRTVALVLTYALTLSCRDSRLSPSAPSTPAPSAPTGTFAVLSTSPTVGGTVALPEGFFVFPQGNGWVQDLTVTIRFDYSEPISNAMVFLVLWRGSEQCLVAEGLVLGAPYGGRFNYVGGSTMTLSGNSFTGTSQCRAGAAGGGRRFTTDRLQFLLMDANKPVESRFVFSQDLVVGWSFE